MKPAQLIPPAFALGWLTLTSAAGAQTATPAPDTAPAAMAPAQPPAPEQPPAQPAAAPGAPVAAPPPADLPPPPPPRGAPPPPPQGSMVISAPPVPPPTLRAGYHTHDGFYLRAALGLGGGPVRVHTDSKDARAFNFGGGGLSLSAWVGGTPWRGVVIGGLIGIQTINDSDVEVDGQSSDQQLQGSMAVIGPFVDVYPDPLRGFHLGLGAGLGGVNAKGNSKALADEFHVTDLQGSGAGGSAWVGYEGWVGGEWSLGGLLQLSGVGWVKEDKDNIKRTADGYALSLNFTAAFH